MEIVANYEIRSDCSVVKDNHVLRVKDPKGKYRARIKNVVRQDYSGPFLISLHLYCEATSLEQAEDAATNNLADCLSMIALITGASLRRHKTKQIVCVEPESDGLRKMLIWADSNEHDNPQPVYNEVLMQSIEKLLQHEIEPAIKRAMRWYRLGIEASVPDDQYVYFWFAFEIVAEFMKSTSKVPSNCPKCRSPLYCNSCNNHPEHKPYPKQAIQALVNSLCENVDNAVFKRIDKFRNELMHGSTLSEIKDPDEPANEHVVDTLGHLLWQAILRTFPKNVVAEDLAICYPTTYLHQRMHMVATIKTVVQKDSEGDLDFSSCGVEVKSAGLPPHSAEPTDIKITEEQYSRLRKLTFDSNIAGQMCHRIYHRHQKQNEHVYVQVISCDMAVIDNALKQGETGEWQDLFREILANQS